MSAEQTTVGPPTVSNSQFLDELARALPTDSLLWTTAFIGNPDGHPGWHGHEYDGSEAARAVVDGYSRQNAYFSTAALRYVDGAIKRRKANFSRLLALVVDDANPDDLASPVSWVLNTSPGKRQVGFFLDEDDPNCADLKLIDAVVTRMATMGLIGGDKSGNNAVRYVRLPQGENQKPRESGPFRVRLIQWNPEIRYSLADAAAALEINLDEIRKLAEECSRSRDRRRASVEYLRRGASQAPACHLDRDPARYHHDRREPGVASRAPANAGRSSPRVGR